jgi:hypothetical protein
MCEMRDRRKHCNPAQDSGAGFSGNAEKIPSLDFSATEPEKRAFPVPYITGRYPRC